MKAVIPQTTTVTGGVWRLYAVTVLILLIFMVALSWNLGRITEITEDAHRTEIIEIEFHDLGEDLLNAETGQRGYLLTLDEKYLEPYLTGHDSAQKRINRLRGLVVNPEARANLERIVPLVAAKFDELAQTITLAQKGQREAALSIVQQGRGKQLMDEFRQLRGTTSNLELNLLAERRARLLTEVHYFLMMVIVGGSLVIVLLFVSALRTARKLGQPITSLLDGIQAIAKGQFDFRVAISSEDEIGRISMAVNDMADHILKARLARDSALEELKRSNAELDSFAYVASHDLKAPLRGIRNLAQWIEEDVEKTATEETHENLRLLKNRVDRLDSLLESMLAYSRIGRKTSSADNVDTGRLISEISEYLAPRPGFVIASQSAMPTLFTPKAPLEQVLRNLISNALKHHDRESGKVEITAQDKGETIEFRVADDGPGIPTEFHERIFQMFQTLKPRDQVEGSGMGLAIVKKTVESFGGQVRVESLPSIRGTTFVFTWPKNFK